MERDEVDPKVEQKIEECWRFKQTKLSLSKEKITDLPISIGKLTHLTELDLSENQLTTLPSSFEKLTQLHELNLSHNRLSSLPKWFSNFAQLRILDLSSNHFVTLSTWLDQLINLEWINLGNNQLQLLPESFGHLQQLQYIKLYSNQFTSLPEVLKNLKELKELDISANSIYALPTWLSELKQLQRLYLVNTKLVELPKWINQLEQLQRLNISLNQIHFLPDELGQNEQLRLIHAEKNFIQDLPTSIAQLEYLEKVDLRNNLLNPELEAAHNEGLDAIKFYLRLRTGPQVHLNQAKLILVGEGEVGKTCLMDALLGKSWEEHPSTHGIEIQQIKVTDFETKKEITLNGWDFGGQRVYRPTHQLFFSAPAVYLVVWKPREGPQQGFVKEWIQLVKRREPTAKIVVVATHGGPQQRQPDIDRQELWDLFGKETVVDFFFVDSKPDENGYRKGIEELKQVVTRVAATLSEVGRSVPKSFADVHAVLQATGAPYLPLNVVIDICRSHNMDDEIASLFITISHRLGHLTHYQNDPALRDIVILRPDWLATAMSYVLDDEVTRHSHGLVDFSRLGLLWNDPSRPAETRYPENLHRIFLRLMERFDLSYRVAGLSKDEDANPVSLIAQLVPDTTPEEKVLERAWIPKIASGDIQQAQICRIVDEKGNSANAEGLFFQLIVRLHKFSLGRTHYDDSMHWQRGLVLDDEYNGRALLRHIGNDVHITVRAPYPEFFLAMLTREVKYLVESFWEGLRCDVMVPCIEPCGRKAAGTGLYEVEKLIDSKRKGRPEFPCPVCNEWQNIDSLLRNAPAAQPISIDELLVQFNAIEDKLDVVDVNTRRVLSQVDKTYIDLLQILTDEAKEGPRLFSLFPLDRGNFNPTNWIREKFRLVLWCEHSRLPLPVLNNGEMKKGVYDLDLDRKWFKKAGPYLKFLSGTLGMVLPLASSAVKLKMDESAYKLIEEQLDFGKSVIDSTLGEIAIISEFTGAADSANIEQGVAIRAENAALRELHTLLKAKDPGFGGLVRVMNKRQEFLWVHEKFASEY